MRVLLFLLLVSAVFDGISEIFIAKEISNLWLMNLFTFVEYIIYCLFYLVVFQKSSLQLYSAIIYAIILGPIGYYTFHNFTTHLSEVTMGIESIMMICSSSVYFSVLLRELEYPTPLSNPLFWFNSAILIYFSSSFFVFIFSDFRGSNMSWDVWDIHSIVRIIFNLLAAIGFWKARKILT